MKIDDRQLNAATLHECLIRELAASVVSSDRRRAGILLSIIERHFVGDLRTELSAHQVLAENRGISRSLAKRIVDELRIASTRVDRTARRRSLRSLVEEIGARLGKNLIPEQNEAETARRALGMIMSVGVSRSPADGASLALAEETLVEFMAAKMPEHLSESSQKLVPGALTAAMRIYSDEYTSKMDEMQRELMAEHVRSVLGANKKTLVETVKRHSTAIARSIVTASKVDGVRQDSKMIERLREAATVLNELWKTEPSTETIEQLMLFHDLRREVES